jgi:hypothetical protein
MRSDVSPLAVAVDVEGSSHQHHYHGPEGFPFTVEVVVTQRPELRPGHIQLLTGKDTYTPTTL